MLNRNLLVNLIVYIVVILLKIQLLTLNEDEKRNKQSLTTYPFM